MFGRDFTVSAADVDVPLQSVEATAERVLRCPAPDRAEFPGITDNCELRVQLLDAAGAVDDGFASGIQGHLCRQLLLAVPSHSLRVRLFQVG